jgi:hypothetical protein
MKKKFLARVIVGMPGVCVRPFNVVSETGDVDECVQYIKDMFPGSYINGFLTDVESNKFPFAVHS